MKLTPQQIAKANELRAIRPPVIPGTNVIVDDTARKEWFDRVTAAMEEAKLTSGQVSQFCDTAGVPD